MGAPAHPDKKAAIEAIQQHLLTHGSKNWNPILERFGHIHPQTVWRWINEAKKGDVEPTRLETARARLKQAIKKDVEQHLPATPSPSYIAREGARAEANIDFVIEIQKLYRDAEMLRAHTVSEVTDDLTGEKRERIKNPAYFDKSIARRANLLEQAIRAVQEIWDLRTMQAFYETVIDEIGAESPETARRILERLAVLNARQGMTLNFRV